MTYNVVSQRGALEAAGALIDGPVPQIIGFGSITTVFNSKQKPKLLRVFGDDFKTYEYVVKGDAAQAPSHQAHSQAQSPA